MDKVKDSYMMGELFSGPGGIALGADLASVDVPEIGRIEITHEWANDIDPDTCETYRKNISVKPEKVICGDVRKLDIGSLPAIDLFSFGFPCNDFSIVGEQKGTDGVYGPLYSYGIQVLRSHKPLCFFAENVSGLRNANDGEDFRRIMNDMFNSGYDVFPHLYKFDEYGIPQSRHRLILIGIRKDLKLKFHIPKPSYAVKTCRDAIENPPISEDAPNNDMTAQSRNVVERLKHIRPGENAFTADIPEELQLNVKGAKLSQIYRRLDPNKPAYTLTGSGGGGTHMYHWSEDRALTNRERARLQTFPDDFEFAGKRESVRKQIGMAVPPLAAKIIFEALIKTLHGIEYEHTEASIPEMVHDNDIQTDLNSNNSVDVAEVSF
jgi:DNA (cytosine-5)-methyltransferase 1